MLKSPNSDSNVGNQKEGRFNFRLDLNRFIFKHIFYLTLKLRREWFLPYLAELEKSQFWSKAQLEQYQLNRINNLLAHAAKNIPYYKDLIPTSLRDLSELSKLPLLEKSEIRNNAQSFMWGKGLHQRYKTSGGSTGAPITLLKDSVGMAQELAATWRGYGWAGVTIGDRQVRFWGVPRNHRDRLRAYLIDFVCNRTRISAFGYGEQYFRRTVRRLSKFNPDYFYGYVSILREFAEFVEKEPIAPNVMPKTIITTSEVLTEFDRTKLVSVFGARIFDEYGCGEIGTITHECEYGTKHINAENVILELLKDDGSVAKPGESGEIVVTDLTNYSMPLIRYRLKDFATLSDVACECGRTLPALEKIHGRQYDTLKNTKGKLFHGEFFLYVVEDAKKEGMMIDGVQFLQMSDLSMVVKVVAEDNSFSKFSEYAKKRFNADFDSSISIHFSQVDKIEREPSGKLRVVKQVLP